MTLAIMDKYNFDEQFAGFYYNEDPACKKELGLNEADR